MQSRTNTLRLPVFRGVDTIPRVYHRRSPIQGFDKRGKDPTPRVEDSRKLANVIQSMRTQVR